MKKLALASIVALTGTMLVHGQGTISLNEGKGVVITNGTSIGEGSGNAYAGNSSYFYEILDMTSTSWNSLSGGQQAGAVNLLANPSDVSLWTDSGVSGLNTGALTSGGIAGAGGATGVSAANWQVPTGSAYGSGAGYDYYIVVGWSANLGTTWSQVTTALTQVAPANAWFGSTAALFNYAGGGTLTAPNVFSPSSFTALAGSGAGTTPANPELALSPVPTPEPTALALAGLGGISMLLLRRRKS